MECFGVDLAAHQLHCPGVPDHQPSTCTGSSYALAFKANADGTAKVYANGKLVDKNLAVKVGETLTRSYTVTRDTTFKVVFTPDKSYVISAFEKLSSYKTATIEKKVSLRALAPVEGSVSSGAMSSSALWFRRYWLYS